MYTTQLTTIADLNANWTRFPRYHWQYIALENNFWFFTHDTMHWCKM